VALAVTEPTDHAVEPPSEALFSRSTTVHPAVRASIAAASPAPPPPVTTTSNVSSATAITMGLA
jgi:hypothetical protein